MLAHKRTDPLNKMVHIIGSGQFEDRRSLEVALEIILARPGDWHPELLGQIPRRVMSDGSIDIECWLRSRSLQHVAATAVDEVMMGLIITRDRAAAPLVSFYLEIGVPVIAVDLEELNILALNERKLTSWFNGVSDSHHNLDDSESTRGDFPVVSGRGVESHFLAGSDSMSSETVCKPTSALRDGDRCKFTRSRVEKAG